MEARTIYTYSQGNTDENNQEDNETQVKITQRGKVRIWYKKKKCKSKTGSEDDTTWNTKHEHDSWQTLIPGREVLYKECTTMPEIVDLN